MTVYKFFFPVGYLGCFWRDSDRRFGHLRDLCHAFIYLLAYTFCCCCCVCLRACDFLLLLMCLLETKLSSQMNPSIRLIYWRANLMAR